MLNWSAELLLAALVVTALATGGLLGLWAATSRWHWFVRTMVVLGLLTPLLWRPIYEPFLTLLTEVATVVLGVTIYRRNWPTWRFSVAGLMMLTVPVAVLVAAIASAPELRSEMWNVMVGWGIVGGLTTLLATWVVSNFDLRRRSIARVLSVAAIAMPLLSVGWSYAQYTDSIMDPCERCCESRYWSLNELPIYYPELCWEALLRTLSLAGLCAGPVLLVRLTNSHSSRISNSLATGCFVVIALWPAWVAVELLTPNPIPEPPAGDNAFDDVLLLAKKIQAQSESAPKSATDAMQDSDYTTLVSYLDRPIELVDSYSVDSWMDDHTTRKSITVLANALTFRANQADSDGDFQHALECALSLFSLARKLEGQGLGENIELSGSIECLAVGAACPVVQHLTHTRCAKLKYYLVNFIETRPSLGLMLQREKIYQQHFQGWNGHIGHYLTLITENHQYGDDVMDGFARRPENDQYYRTGLAATSLLATDLALREYRAIHGDWPDRLDELTPEFLPMVYVDPFSTTGAPLVYRPNEADFALYSRWTDSKDEGGILRKRPNIFAGGGWFYDGDLSLEAYFAEED